MKKHSNWRTVRLTMKEAEIIRIALGYLPFEYREGKGDEYDSAYDKIEPLTYLKKKTDESCRKGHNLKKSF